MRIQVRIFNLDNPKVDESTRTINLHRDVERKFLLRTMWWAFSNNRGMEIVSDEEEGEQKPISFDDAMATIEEPAKTA
jgi:hypothetical protein